MLLGRHKVNEVFTPRRNEVNREIYVERPALEKELQRAIQGAQHPVVYGESGSGKSWLYKKVLSGLNAYVVVANSGTAQRLGSLTREIAIASGAPEQLTLKAMDETIHAEANAVVARGGATSTRSYEIDTGDPLYVAFERIRKAARSAPAVLVIDNLELIVGSKPLMEELASIITLIDDSRFAKFQVKLLLVGVPSVVRDYFLNSPATQSIANRLIEVSEVPRLSSAQVAELVHKGFRELLKVHVSETDLATWAFHINYVTLGYAQAVQEYCEQLGYLVEESDWKGTLAQLRDADARWLKQGLAFAAGHVTVRMNERETRAGRRDQVLYALGRVQAASFSTATVESIVRTEFPESTADTTLAIGQILTELCGRDHPILKRSAAGNEYEFRDARLAMAVRVLLEKEATREKVRRVANPREIQ